MTYRLDPRSSPDSSGPQTWHLDGVSWYDAPPPPRRHDHWPQTRGELRVGDFVERCPCGAIRDPSNTADRSGGWVLLDPPRVATAPPRPDSGVVAFVARWARRRGIRR